jgi:hypothetical protein
MAPVGFEPTIPRSKRPLTHHLDRAAIGIGVRMTGMKNLYLRIGFRSLRIHNTSMHENTLHDLILIKLIIARFVGAGGFLIRYSNGHTK